jgi:oligopeptidase B
MEGIMSKPICALALLSVFSFSSLFVFAQDRAMLKPPAAKKNPKVTELHGEKLVDDYYWLREKTNPEVISYLKAEDDYASAVMKPTEQFQSALYSEILGRVKETDMNVPYRFRDYYYYSRTEKGKQYPILCRKRGSLDQKEEVYLDINELGKGLKFISLGPAAVSNDNNLLAYSTDTTGFRQFTLYFKDLRTGRLISGTAERVTSLAWANDNKTVFYVVEDPVAKRPYRLYRHTLGQPSHELLYEEKDALYTLGVTSTRSKAYIFALSSSSNTTEIRFIASDKPADSFKVILPREGKHRYYVDHHGDRFYIRTNENAINFRLVSAPVADPQKKNWKEIVPHRKDVMIEGTDLFAGHLIVRERDNGLQKVRVTDLKTAESHYIEFPEPVYTVFTSGNAEFDTATLRFNYQSLVTPSSVYDYDLQTRKRVLLKQTEVMGGYNPSEYKSERITATASDGTRIPISLVYKKDLVRDGKRPMLLEGYGSYGAPSFVFFDSAQLSLLNRGVICATAHIRGGGDLGEPWHDEGKMMKKKNTFTDFISVAEHLINEKYTSRDRLIIAGGSAGGLLMGAVLNMRPDLFKAAVVYVPFVDVINTMLDESLPLTVGEFLEWGNPKIKAEYDYMKTYSPYENIAAKEYPAMLVRTSLNDSQVMYWEPAKYVARLREMKRDSNPLLFKVKLDPAGHGGASGRYDAMKDTAFDYAFMLWQWGITK